MDNNRPIVSIVCIAYNHEPFIRECLNSILAQQVEFPIEILVNDDCSKDNTAKIIKEYEIKYPDLFRCVYQSENQYSKMIHPWFDILFPMTKGKYIALCEGDDFWTDPYKLQKQVNILEADETLIGVATNRTVVDLQGHILEKRKPHMIMGRQSSYRITMRDFFKYNVTYSTASVMYRNDDDHKNDILQKTRHMRNPYLGDWTLWIALHCFGDFYYLDEVTSAYRINPASVTHTQWVKARVDKIKYEFDLQPRIAEILPDEYSDIAANLRNTNWVHGALVKAYYKNKSYFRMFGELFVMSVKFPQFYKELAEKIYRKLRIIVLKCPTEN